MDAETIKRLLNLEPLTFEGGFFRETYRSPVDVSAGQLPPRYTGARSAGTAIYYLLDRTTFSGMHRLASDETYHFYLGQPVEMLMLYPDGAGERVVLGSDLTTGQRPQHTVPAGVWQGSRLIEDGRGDDFALMGTTMAPGFAFDDFEGATAAALTATHPAHAELIAALTRG